MTMPSISLIIPTRNERQTLPSLIDQLVDQNYAAELYEIVVVDRQSTDGSGDLVRRRYSGEHVPVRVIENAQASAAAARNAGIRATSGDVVVFLTGRCVIPSRNWLADTAAILEESGAGCLCRPGSSSGPAGTRTGEAIAQVRASWLGRGALVAERGGFVDATQGGSTYRRDVFERVGLYEETFEGCEDLELNTRVAKAGITAYIDPRLAVQERAPDSLARLLRQMILSGRGKCRWMREHPECGSMAEIAPLGVLLVLLLSICAWVQLPAVVAAIVTLPLAIFPAATMIASVQLGLRHGVRAACRAPWIFAAIYLGEGMGFLFGYGWPPPDREAVEIARRFAVEGKRETAGESDRAA
jgi:hypothetical protein